MAQALRLQVSLKAPGCSSRCWAEQLGLQSWENAEWVGHLLTRGCWFLQVLII